MFGVFGPLEWLSSLPLNSAENIRMLLKGFTVFPAIKLCACNCTDIVNSYTDFLVIQNITMPMRCVLTVDVQNISHTSGVGWTASGKHFS